MIQGRSPIRNPMAIAIPTPVKSHGDEKPLEPSTPWPLEPLTIAMRRSSRNRLTAKQRTHFPGENLFDRIARAVCRAGVLPAKELFEAWEVARRVRRKYRGGRVVDLAGGHGLLAHIMLILDDITPRNRLLLGHPAE